MIRTFAIVGLISMRAGCAGSPAAQQSNHRRDTTVRAPKKAPPPAPAKAGRAPWKASDIVDPVAGRSNESAPSVLVSPQRASSPPSPETPGTVKAGASDDNMQFNAFLAFMRASRGLGLPFAPDDRRVIQVSDNNGRPWPGAKVDLIVGGQIISSKLTYADGRTLLFPTGVGVSRAHTPVGPNAAPPRVRVTVAGRRPLEKMLGARRKLAFVVSATRPTRSTVPLDIAFVLDTTGSMQDEIDQLRATLRTINFQFNNASPRPDVRYGMVLYRDRGDDYRVKHIPFTRDLDAFTAALAVVSAAGGDDYREDVQAGLQATFESLQWINRGVKVAFLIGDAPPHLDYKQSFTYLDAARVAAERGIKITTIGASGLNREGEVVWRQIAQQTMAPFVFLTYGESGDSEGSPSSVSHHVGANWVADDLDAIVIRMVKQELAHWRPGGAPEREDYFIARPSRQQTAEQVLEELFRRSAQQLVDYAVEALEARTPTVLMPLRATDSTTARMLERRLAIGLSRQGRFQLIERDQRKEVLVAVSEQMAKSYDGARMVEVGKMIPAQLAVLGSIDPDTSGRVELLVKLVRLKTGEVLSLSLMRIDSKLL